jgi:hypothetical protein
MHLYWLQLIWIRGSTFFFSFWSQQKQDSFFFQTTLYAMLVIRAHTAYGHCISQHSFSKEKKECRASKREGIHIYSFHLTTIEWKRKRLGFLSSWNLNARSVMQVAPRTCGLILVNGMIWILLVMLLYVFSKSSIICTGHLCTSVK